MTDPHPRVAAAVVAASGRPGIRRAPAQRLAHRELARSIYRPSVWQRILNAIKRWLDFGSIGRHGSGWALILLAVAVLLIIGAAVYLGPARRSRRRRPAPVLAGSQLTAADHRRNAERLAADGDLAGAIVERVRAIAVELEARGILLPRPGRTASELATEAGGSLPASAAGLRDAARLFDDVRYGGRAGTLAGYQRVRDLDASIEAARTPAVSLSAGAGDGTEPPA